MRNRSSACERVSAGRESRSSRFCRRLAPGRPPVAIQERGNIGGAGEPQCQGLGERALQFAQLGTPGQVVERARGRGDRDVVMRRDFIRAQRAHQMDAQAWPGGQPTACHQHVHAGLLTRRQNLPAHGGAPVAQHRAGAIREHSRHLARTRCGDRAHQVHTLVDPAQPARCRPAIHDIRRHTGAQQLTAGHHTMLSHCDRCDHVLAARVRISR